MSSRSKRQGAHREGTGRRSCEGRTKNDDMCMSLTLLQTPEDLHRYRGTQNERPNQLQQSHMSICKTQRKTLDVELRIIPKVALHTLTVMRLLKAYSSHLQA